MAVTTPGQDVGIYLDCINNIRTVRQGFVFFFWFFLLRVEVVSTGGHSRKIRFFENSSFGNNQSQT
jgi:hypothetical protein